jgi:hypothetical protein
MTSPRHKYETRWITPSSAKEYLELQVNNRPLSWGVVRQYARDMLNGDWLMNGENIKLNPEGFMLDGQHRMTAVILAAKMYAEKPEEYSEPFEGIFFEFALNIPNESRQSMDIGKKRSLADEMSFEGGENAGRTAPIVSWHIAYLKGNYTNAGGSSWRPTQAQALEAWRENKKLYYTTTLRAYDASRQGLGATAPLGVAYHLLRTTYGDELTERFWEQLITGANLSVGHPILALRNKLLRKDVVNRKTLLALVFKTWNSWIDGRILKDAPYFKQEVTNKNFPQPRDPNDKKVPNPEFATQPVDDGESE